MHVECRLPLHSPCLEHCGGYSSSAQPELKSPNVHRLAHHYMDLMEPEPCRCRRLCCHEQCSYQLQALVSHVLVARVVVSRHPTHALADWKWKWLKG